MNSPPPVKPKKSDGPPVSKKSSPPAAEHTTTQPRIEKQHEQQKTHRTLERESAVMTDRALDTIMQLLEKLNSRMEAIERAMAQQEQPQSKLTRCAHLYSRIFAESPSLVGDVHADSALSTSKLGRQYVALDSDCMSVKSEHNLTNALIQNNCRAPMASLECLDEGTLSSGSSVLASQPPTRQVSMFAPPAVRYRNLGKSGLRISNVGLGTWVTFGSLISEEVAEDIVTAAFDNGINVFDTADIYAGGKAEVALGKVLKKKRWRRSSYVVTTKLFWATKSDSERGLSRKAIIEGLQASLERLQLSYVDIMLINKADSMCPMEGKFTSSLNDRI
ncbi:hypothetical protein MTO96_009241 [Rhipicephalus appendiculatus]